MNLRILDNYYLNGNPNYGKTVVRTGFYYITALLPHEPEKRERLVTALWNHEGPTFYPAPVFTINLATLYNSVSESLHKVVPVEHLLQAVIRVDEVTLEEIIFNNEPSKAYKVKWELIKYIQPSELFRSETSATAEAIPNPTSCQEEESEDIVSSLEEQIREIEQLEEEELLQLLYDEYIINLNREDDLNLLYDEHTQKEKESEDLSQIADDEEECLCFEEN